MTNRINSKHNASNYDTSNWKRQKLETLSDGTTRVVMSEKKRAAMEIATLKVKAHHARLLAKHNPNIDKAAMHAAAERIDTKIRKLETCTQLS